MARRTTTTGPSCKERSNPERTSFFRRITDHSIVPETSECSKLRSKKSSPRCGRSAILGRRTYQLRPRRKHLPSDINQIGQPGNLSRPTNEGARHKPYLLTKRATGFSPRISFPRRRLIEEAWRELLIVVSPMKDRRARS
jgi:hypothetical protein